MHAVRSHWTCSAVGRGDGHVGLMSTRRGRGGACPVRAWFGARWMPGEFLGNFPQVFSHVGVLASGLRLLKAQRRETDSELRS